MPARSCGSRRTRPGGVVVVELQVSGIAGGLDKTLELVCLVPSKAANAGKRSAYANVCGNVQDTPRHNPTSSGSAALAAPGSAAPGSAGSRAVDRPGSAQELADQSCGALDQILARSCVCGCCELQSCLDRRLRSCGSESCGAAVDLDLDLDLESCGGAAGQEELESCRAVPTTQCTSWRITNLLKHQRLQNHQEADARNRAPVALSSKRHNPGRVAYLRQSGAAELRTLPGAAIQGSRRSA